MLIEHREYIAIMDEIEYLKKDNSLLKEQNSLLTHQLLKAKQKIQSLTHHHKENIKLIDTLHLKSLSHQSQNTKSVISHISKTTQQTKLFLNQKFHNLQDLTINQNKEIQTKIAKMQFELYQLNEFINKIRLIHKDTTSLENHQNKKLSLAQLTKWIKSLAFCSLSMEKLGITSSSSTVSMKKHAIKHEKLKEAKQTINYSQSQSSFKVY